MGIEGHLEAVELDLSAPTGGGQQGVVRGDA